MTQITTTLIDDISQVFIDQGFDNVVHYVGGGEDEQNFVGGSLLNNIKIEENEVYRLIQPVSIDHNGIFNRNTKGLIEEGKLFMFSIAHQPKLAVQDMTDWLKVINTSPLGGFNLPEIEVTLGDVKFWRFRPPGVVNMVAERFGDQFYVIDQLIEYAARNIAND